MCMSIRPAFLCVHHVVPSAQGGSKCQVPWRGAKVCEVPYGCQDLNPGTLKEDIKLLTAVSSLQLSSNLVFIYFILFFF